MRSRASRRLLAIAACAAALAPAVADAFEWRGRLGLVYTRDDTWTGGAQATMPNLDLNAALDASGFVHSPGVLTYSGGGEYRRATFTRPGEQESVRDLLNYRLRSSLFSRPWSPLGLNLHASQQQEDFSAGAAGAGTVGTLFRSYGGDLHSSGLGRPSISAGYTRLESSTDFPVLPRDDRTIDTASAAVSMGGPSFSYSGRYRGYFSDGTNAVDDYDDHQVDVDATGRLGDKTELRVSDRYTRRVPRNDAAFNPSHELNSLFASLGYRPSVADYQLASYRYTHAIQEIALGPEAERTLHRAAYAIQRDLEGGRWRLRGEVDATVSLDRLGDVERRSMGQTVGGLAVWRALHDAGRLLELRGGPTVGVLEPEGGDVELGYGGTAGTTWSRTQTSLLTQLSYDVTYAQDLGVEGWSLTQRGSGSAEGPFAGGRLRGQLTLSGARRDSPTFGVGGSRTIAASGAYRFRVYSVTATLGYQSGLTNPVMDPGIGDGLLLGLPYDSHSLHASLAATARLTRWLSAGASARVASSDSPGRGPRDEAELRAHLEYNIGALRLALEERYFVVSGESSTFRHNQVLVKVYRAFGSR